MDFFDIDWASMFTLGVSPLETVFRGTIVYGVLLALFRLVPRRTTGDVGMMDLAVLVLIAEAAHTAMAADSMTLLDGVILVITLMGWNYAINRLTYAVPGLERLVSRPALQIVRDGRILHRNMASEQITREELDRQMRENGIGDVKAVKVATVESDGKVTFVER